MRSSAQLSSKPAVVVIGHHSVEWHDAFLQFAARLFGQLNFRRWYEFDGWDANYRAFAIFEGPRIVANASVQRMQLVMHGEERAGWQLGAVGVLPEWRGRGLQRQIMDVLLKSLPAGDLVFAAASEDLFEFYPQFGFGRVQEWLFGFDRTIEPAAGCLRRLSFESSADRVLLTRIAANAQPVTRRFGARNYGSVLLWYWTNFFDDCFYYHEHDDAIVVAQEDLEVLRICDVLATRPIDLATYLPQLLSQPTAHIEFEFTPEQYWPDVPALHEYMETALFVRGEFQAPVGPWKFPVLAQT